MALELLSRRRARVRLQKLYGLVLPMYRYNKGVYQRVNSCSGIVESEGCG